MTDVLTRTLMPAALATGTVTTTQPLVTSKSVPATRYEEWEGKMLITEMESGSMAPTETERATFLNTVQTVHSDLSGTPEAVLRRDEDVNNLYFRVTGALMNPAPVNGKHYAIIDDDGVEMFTVRYNDDDHRGDRHKAHCPFSIVLGRSGNPHPLDNDSLAANWVIPAYFEVEAPGSETAGRPAVTEEAVTEPEPVTAAATWGLAETGADGTIQMNPEPEVGKAYLLWEDEDSVIRTLALRSATGWNVQGTYRKSYGGDVLSYTAHAGAGLYGADKWVKIATTAPSPAPAEGRFSQLTTDLTAAVARWESLNDALVSMAEDKSWCSEYEDFAEPLGLRLRNTKKDWVVRGRADVTFTTYEPSSYVDERVASSLDMPGLVISSMTVTGSVDFSISVEDVSEDEARDYVNRTEVEEWIESNASGLEDLEVTDYTISDVDED